MSGRDGGRGVPFGAELRSQLTLAGPLCLGHLGQHLLSVVDAAMLGRFSDAALAGAGVASALFFAVSVMGVGLVLGLDTLVPQALGAGEEARARGLYHAGLRVALLSGLALSGLCVASIGLLDIAGAEPEVREEAFGYLLARTPSLIPSLLAVAARSYLQAKLLTRAIVISTIIANVVNVVANGLLIYGDRSLLAVGLPAVGLPELGVVGAGLSSSLVSVASTAIVIAAASAVESPRESRRGDARSVVIQGAPVGVQLSLEVGIFAAASALAARMGTVPAAAHQIALTLASLSFSIALGFGASTSVRVGRAVGRGDSADARRAGLAGIALGSGLMALFGIAFLAAPGALAGIFTNEALVVATAVPLLRVAALFQLSDATQAVLSGALRGAGDSRSTLIGNLCGHYLIGLPLMLYLGFERSLGATGLWWALSAGLTAVAIALVVRFLWLTNKPIARS